MLFEFFQEVVDNQIDIKNNDWQFLNDYFNDNVPNDFTQQIEGIDTMTHHSQEQIRMCCSILNDQIEYDNITNIKLKQLYVLKLFCFVYWIWKYNNIDNGNAFDNDFINDTFVEKYNEGKVYIDMMTDFNENSHYNDYKDLIVEKLDEKQLNEFETFIHSKYNLYKKQMYIKEQIERRNKKCQRTQRCIIGGLMIICIGKILLNCNIYYFWDVLSFFDKLMTHAAILTTLILPTAYLIYQDPENATTMYDMYRSAVGCLIKCKNVVINKIIGKTY
jgi:uncharacterized protein YktA (UPF0223 family)